MGGVLVVGGSNTDIVGVPDGRYLPRESNPGHVTQAAGGVGRNIAENLARIGVATLLVTAFGDDAHGAVRRDECSALGIDVSRSVATPGVAGSVYLAVLDDAGDLATAVSDMRALEFIGPAQIETALRDVGEPDAVVFEANLRPDTLVRLGELLPETPRFLECVSAAKAGRLAALLPGAAGIHANVAEAGVLCGREFERSRKGALEAALELALRGVHGAYVTAGEHGTAWASGPACGTLPAPAGLVANATGAGDAFMAGVVAATLNGREPHDVAAYASACGGITLRTERTVAEELTEAQIVIEMEEARR